VSMNERITEDTMSTEKQTAGPWAYVRMYGDTATQPERRYRLLGPPTIEDKAGWGFRREADAAFIVNAANSNDALTAELAALRTSHAELLGACGLCTETPKRQPLAQERGQRQPESASLHKNSCRGREERFTSEREGDS
jgi:hypothetical protein